MLKKLIALTLSLLTVTCIAATPATLEKPFGNANSAIIPINKIVAIVNNNVITQMQLDKQIAFVTANLKSNHAKLPPAAILNKQILNQLINEDLQLQLAKRSGIQISSIDVAKAIKVLAAKNGKTPAEMLASIQAMGLTTQEFHTQVRKEILINKIQKAQVASRISITPDEVNEFLRSNAGQSLDKTEYHLADILITLPNTPTAAQIAAAKKQADAVFAQASKGKNFRTLAIANSKGQNALQGGDLGWRQLLKIPSVFAAKALNMKTGEVAGPLRTPNGFYIIKLLGARAQNNNKALTPAQLKIAVENLIFQRKLQERLQNWILQLRASAYIKILS